MGLLRTPAVVSGIGAVFLLAGAQCSPVSDIPEASAAAQTEPSGASEPETSPGMDAGNRAADAPSRPPVAERPPLSAPALAARYAAQRRVLGRERRLALAAQRAAVRSAALPRDRDALRTGPPGSGRADVIDQERVGLDEVLAKREGGVVAHPRALAAWISSSTSRRRSLPKYSSSPTKKLGEPKTPRATTASGTGAGPSRR